MKRSNLVYLIGGALSVALLIFGYQYYQDSYSANGLEINLDGNGISIQKQ
jgi:hypothetical protein